MDKTEFLSIIDCLDYQASEYPGAEALVFEEETYTWSELSGRVRCRSGALARLGFAKGEVIGLFLPNTPEFVITHLALLSRGLVSCPLDPTLKSLEIGALIEGMELRAIVTDQKWAGSIGEISDVTVYTVESLPEEGEQEQVVIEEPAAWAATMLFTSGTTGRPKATLYSHASHLWNVRTLASLWKWDRTDSLLLSLPLSHWHGLVVGLTGWIYTGCVLYLERQFQAGRTLALLSSGKISLFMHVPPAYFKLVHANPDESYDLTCVRLFISGSSYLPPSLWEEFRNRYGHEIVERYGSSEAGIIASNTLEKRVAGSVGCLLPGVEAVILDGGELGIKSPGTFLGYYHNPHATGNKFTPEGYLKTGDLAEMEPDGRITLKGRLEERIKKYAYTINPRDVEWALAKNPAVSDVFVLGVQGGGLDDEIVAFVTPKGEVDEECLLKFSRENLPFYWRPDRYLFMEEIPKTRSGKPQIKKLRQMAEESVPH